MNEWPEKIEKGLAPFITKPLKSNDDIMVLAVDKESSFSEEDDEYDILGLPENVLFKRIGKGNIEQFLSSYMKGSWESEQIPHEKEENHDKKTVVLICSHMKRDKRCGVLGPMIANEFYKLFKEKNIDAKIHEVSHVGGHKFAGNVIIYPGGYWYGRVTPCLVKTLVENHIEKGNIVKELYRGKMGERGRKMKE